MEDAGINVKYEIKGSELTIKVDLSKDFGPSKSGKTKTIASTSGIKYIDKDKGLMLGLNVNRK